MLQLQKLYVVSTILLLDVSYGADFQFEACGPRNCGNGPNVSFPFYIQGVQESYCGYAYPGFILNCSANGYPVLHLGETEYVIEDIFYETQSFRVHNPAFLNSDNSNCLPRFRNTTLLKPQFDFADNVTDLHLFSNCTSSSSEEMSFCDGSRALALYDGDDSDGNAKENCGTNLVAPVENGDMDMGNLAQALRKGFVINWKASDCSVCRNSGGHCGFNETFHLFRCFCPESPHSGSCRLPLPLVAGKGRKRLVLATGFGAAIVATSILILLILAKRKMVKVALNDKNIEALLKQCGNLSPQRYKYSELKKMTKSFNDKLGEGGYGSVYKATTKDGRVVAVKVLNESKSNGEEFVNEVASISRTSHINIVGLLGFCFEGTKRALVYEFMPNGSLDKFLGNPSPSAPGIQLGWGKLFEIVVGIARGLEYLHRGCNMQILHFDIKPHNILLDKDFTPKISDFGLAKLCPNRASSIMSMLEARGTVGYIAPEVFCRTFGKASHKSDVYSYGMMVLDVAGERINADPVTSEKYFPEWIYKHLESSGDYIVDVEDEEARTTKRKLTIVGLWCIQSDPKDRPSMSKVVEMLAGEVDSLPFPPKPYLSSPSRQTLDHASNSQYSSLS